MVTTEGRFQLIEITLKFICCVFTPGDAGGAGAGGADAGGPGAGGGGAAAAGAAAAAAAAAEGATLCTCQEMPTFPPRPLPLPLVVVQLPLPRMGQYS